MSEMIEKLWPAFFSEVSEQLDTLELCLLHFESIQECDVDELFREFHTIKSSCSMMSFTSMEEIAHASEDLLDLVRNKKLPYNNDINNILIKSVDCLKVQLELAGKDKENPESNPGLLQELKSYCGSSNKNDLIDREPHNDSIYLDETFEGNKEKDSEAKDINEQISTNKSCSDELYSNISKDNNSYIEFSKVTSSLLQDLLVVKPIKSKNKLADLIKSKITLKHAAQKTGFNSIVRILDKIFFPLAKEEEDIKFARMSLMSSLLDRLSYFEESHGLECGVNNARKQIRKSLAEEFSGAASKLSEKINTFKDQFTSSEDFNEREEFNFLIKEIDSALVYSNLTGFHNTVELLLFIKQVLREIRRNNIELDKPLLDLLCMACNLPGEVDVHKGEEGSYLVICEQLYSELNDAISGSMALDEIIKKQEYIGQKIDINSDFLSLLTLKSLDQLIEAIDDGRNIFEIEADLEESQVIGEEFVNWLYSSGTIISNKTIFHHKNLGQGEVEATKLRFLVTFNIPVQEVKQFLGEMDEERDLFVLSKCKYFDDVNESKIPDDSNSIIKKISFPGAINAANETLRVNSKNLDKFVNQVGELVTLHNMMSHTLYDNDYLASLRRGKNILRELKSSVNVSNDELNTLIQCLDNIEIHNQEVQQINSRLKTTLGNVQEGVMDLRVVPVATVFNRLPRLVRDLSNAQGKKVQLNITGDDVQIDKGLVEVLVEPLMHIVRNCIDHGIESAEERASSAKPEIATLTLNTIQHNGSLLLELSDDGRGLNYEKILQQAIRNNTLSSKESVNLTEQELTNLIFLPGFSTSDEVTETSGRGVGMDVVKTRITQFGGSIDINSKPGEGTKFILRLPLSVAIQGVVLVGSGGQTYAIPERNVTEVIKASDNDLQVIQGQSVILLRNMTLPLYRLDKLMGNDICNNDSLDQEFDVVIVSNGKFRIGLIVDKIMERQEVFIRDLHSDIAAIPGVGGVSILGDGSVIIILDCENLFDLAAKNAHSLSSLVNA